MTALAAALAASLGLPGSVPGTPLEAADPPPSVRGRAVAFSLPGLPDLGAPIPALALEPWDAARPPGPLLARIDLSKSAAAARGLGEVSLEGRDYAVGLAAGPGFKGFYLVLDPGAAASLHPIPKPEALLDGVPVALPGGGRHRLSLSLDLTAPVRGSELVFSPEPGTPGQPQRRRTGRILDRLRKSAPSLTLSEDAVHLVLCLDEVDPASRAPSGARSLVFFRERSFLPEVARLPLAALRAGTPAKTRLGGRTLILLLGSAGDLAVHSLP